MKIMNLDHFYRDGVADTLDFDCHLAQLPRSKANFRRFREVRFVFSTSASRKLKIVTNIIRYFP